MIKIKTFKHKNEEEIVDLTLTIAFIFKLSSMSRFGIEEPTVVKKVVLVKTGGIIELDNFMTTIPSEVKNSLFVKI